MEILYTADVDPSSLAFDVRFGDPPSEELRAEFDSLLTAWYKMALHGAFDGYAHNITDTTWADESAKWSMDFGSASEEALNAFFRILADFSKSHSIEIESVQIGWPDEE